MPETHNNARAALIALTSYAVFSGSDTVIKLVSEVSSLAQTTFISSGLAALFMLIQAAVTGRLGSVVARYPLFTIGRAVILAIETGMIFYAFTKIPLTQAYVLAFMAPIFVAILAFVFLGERLSRLAAFGVVLGFIGVLIVLRPTSSPLQFGHLMAISSSFLFAITLLMLRRAKPGESDLALAVAPLILLSLSALAFTLWSGGFVALDITHLAISVLGGLCFYLGNILLVRAFRIGQPSVIAPFQYSQIFWGSMFSYFVFGVGVDAMTIFGAAVVVVSGILVLK